jgi:hypothetical protein
MFPASALGLSSKPITQKEATCLHLYGDIQHSLCLSWP